MKAQASLDSLIMIGLGLVLAAAFFYVANTMLGDSISAAQAQEAVELIASEASYVHSCAQGTIRYVDVVIPNGVEEVNIDGKRVHMRVQLSSGSTDFFSNTPMKMVGGISAEPGLERVVIRNLPSGNVQVGQMKLSASPRILYFQMKGGESEASQLIVSNDADYTIDGIEASLEGLQDIVTINDPPAALSPSENGSIGIWLSVPSEKSIGTYTGYIRINSTNGGSDDVLLSVSVQGGTPTSCSISPSPADLSLGQAEQFTVDCVDSSNESVPCPLMSWSSDGGSMIPALSYSSSTLVASNQEGSHVNASAGFGCRSPITVSGNGPLVSALFITPSSPAIDDSIWVNATADDEDHGDLNVSICQVRIDGGAWLGMIPADGAYDELAEDVSLEIGSLSAGSHMVSVRCNNTDGKFGSYSGRAFVVNGPPAITSLFTSPALISAGDRITIRAIADDSGGGDDNISTCQLRIDNGAFLEMVADDGAYDEISEDVSLDIGPRSAGAHNATIKCNDSDGLASQESTINFTVNAKPILFIHDGSSMSAHETVWTNWLDTHSSGMGYDWAYDTAQDTAVVNGSVNLTDYRIVLMAEYDSGSGIGASLADYQADGGVIVLLADSMENGPSSLGYTGSAGIADSENEVWVVNNTHYMTSGLPSGKITILTIAAEIWRSADSLGGTILADGMKANKQDNGKPALDDSGSLITWGVTTPESFNSNGNTITTRMVDFALDRSTIGG